eukprot:g29345.t1
MGRCYTFSDCRGRSRGAVGVVGSEGRVDQGVPEGSVPAEGKRGLRGEYVSGGGILLEVVEMVADELLDVDVGGMVVGDTGYCKGYGPDNILEIVMKTCAPELITALAKLFQYSYNTGIYPAMWKIYP